MDSKSSSSRLLSFKWSFVSTFENQLFIFDPLLLMLLPPLMLLSPQSLSELVRVDSLNGSGDDSSEAFTEAGWMNAYE